MARWRDARFGMFIHWGPVSLTGKEIGWARGREIPVDEYDSLYKRFNPTRFSPDEWVSIAKAAGMKYMVLTTKHHDGFVLWDTKQTPYNIMSSPFRRDVVKELAAAARQQGLGFGAYYSTCDWHHPDFPLTSPGGKVRRPTSNLDRYTEYLKAQVRELLTNYGPLFTLWFDVPQEFDEARGQGVINMARTIQPDIVINNRSGAPGDYRTPEQFVPTTGHEGDWETCMTLNNQWAYSDTDQDWKSSADLIRKLADIASKGGNFLLNVGPDSQGVIPVASVDRLREVGKWMSVNGDAIYGTTRSPFARLSYGVATRKGNSLYVHVFDWPAGQELRVPLRSPVKSASLLGRPGSVLKVRAETDRVVVDVPKSAPDAAATVVALELGAEPVVLPLPTANAGVKTSASSAAADAPAPNVLDGTAKALWRAADGQRAGWVEIDLGAPTALGAFAFDEPDVWPRVRQRFRLEVPDGSAWKPIASGLTVGHGHEANLPPTTARRVRLVVERDDAPPSIAEWRLYRPE
jgi:alpha-L-fucosidase